MEIALTTLAKRDVAFWKSSGNSAVLKRIRGLLESIVDSPYQVIGKPEPLKYELSGLWSRRISQSDRLVYEVKADIVYVYSLKGHYNQ